MIKSLLQKGLARYGYEIRRMPEFAKLGYDHEDQAEAAIRAVRPYTMLSKERLLTLYQQVRFCEEHRIPGAFVECGVWKGGSVALMALANLESGRERRHLHLFDAFTEICEPDADVDGQRAVDEVRTLSRGGGVGGRLVPVTGIYDAFGGPGSVEGNRRLLENLIGYDATFVHFHVGWFQDTIPKLGDSIPEIAILRLDGDWYASTKVCLEGLYDRVASGGFVIVDDYGAYDGCKKAVDEFREARGIRAFLHHIDRVGRYWVKP